VVERLPDFPLLAPAVIRRWWVGGLPLRAPSASAAPGGVSGAAARPPADAVGPIAKRGLQFFAAAWLQAVPAAGQDGLQFHEPRTAETPTCHNR